MTLNEFKSSLAQAAPPVGVNVLLQALWWDAKGDWDAAHRLAQAVDNADGSRVHAYLHRKEGDLGNASYWYSRAGTRMPAVSLNEEWEQIAAALL